MAGTNEKYYSLQGGLSYKMFLDHFKGQARGSQNIALLKDTRSNQFKKPSVNGSLVLVDLASHEPVNKRGEKQPKVEIVDPNESARRRAVEQVAEERKATKTYQSKKDNHSSSGSRGVKKGGVKRGRPSSNTNKSIKRARDIFEK